MKMTSGNFPRHNGGMVLPKGIEPLTSALPRMRSTTELRQHVRGRRAYAACIPPRQPDLPGPVTQPSFETMANPDPDPERAERLAAALRINLRRRKEQARTNKIKDESKPAEI